MTQTARERLFARSEGRTKDVTLDGGDVVQVRALSFLERTDLVKDCTVDGEVDMKKLVPLIIIATVHHAGAPMFTAGDLEEIQRQPAIEIDPLWAAAAELNGLSQEAAKDAKNG